MATNDVKCACSDCACMISTETAIHKDGKIYCCEACASGHAEHAGCGHSGCDCRG